MCGSSAALKKNNVKMVDCFGCFIFTTRRGEVRLHNFDDRVESRGELGKGGGGRKEEREGRALDLWGPSKNEMMVHRSSGRVESRR